MVVFGVVCGVSWMLIALLCVVLVLLDGGGVAGAGLFFCWDKCLWRLYGKCCVKRDVKCYRVVLLKRRIMYIMYSLVCCGTRKHAYRHVYSIVFYAWYAVLL